EEFLIVSAIIFTELKSPLEEAGNPTSIRSTPYRSSCLAISIFSSWFKFTPGDCSPSRNVVSKMKIFDILTSHPFRRFVMAVLQKALKHGVPFLPLRLDVDFHER